MLTTKKLERAIAKYNLNSAEPFLAVLIKAAQLREAHEVQDPGWSKEALKAALYGKASLLSNGGIEIAREEFLRIYGEIAEVWDKAIEKNEEDAVDFDAAAFFTQERLDVLAESPYALWDMVEDEKLPDEVLEGLLPCAGFALRVFFDEAASEASAAMNRLVADTVHFERSLSCPVCGGAASLAAVASTTNKGNVKRLYCSCCGASWQFERIRCAVCGTQAVSDLSYVHEESDENHRLHVCKACSGAMPTVFAGEGKDFDPDVESFVCAELEMYYDENKAGEQGSGHARGVLKASEYLLL